MDTMLALYANSRKMGSENVLYNPFRIHEGGAAPCLPRALGLVLFGDKITWYCFLNFND